MVDDNTTGFAVQKWDEPTQSWRMINNGIRITHYMNGTTSRETAIRLAEAEAQRQAAGWQTAFPLRNYRAVPSTTSYFG